MNRAPLNSHFSPRRFYLASVLLNQRASILITAVWLAAILAVFTGMLSREAGPSFLLLKKEAESVRTQTVFFSALQAADEQIAGRERGSVLSERIALPAPWRGSIDATLEDEEGKLNLNTAEETLLSSFWDLVNKQAGPLKGGKKDFIDAVLKAREKSKIISFEELYLIEDLERKDLDKIEPFVTVDSESPALNINTSGRIPLEALMRALNMDELVQKDILEKWSELRRKAEEGKTPLFLPRELSPNEFMRRLGLTPSVQMTAALNLFLPRLETDSETYRIRLQEKNGARAEAVVRRRTNALGMEILKWEEA